MKVFTLGQNTSLIYFAVLLLLIFSTLGFADTRILMVLFIGLTIFFFAFLIKSKGIYKSQVKLFLPFVLLICAYIINYFTFPTVTAINSIMFYITYALLLFIVSNFVWKKFHFKLFHLISLVTLTVLLSMILYGISDINVNRIGAWAFILLFFPILYVIEYGKRFKKIKLLVIFSFVGTIIYLSDSRSVMLSLMFMLLTFFVWKLITRNKIFFNLYFLFIILISFGYTVIYPMMDKIFVNFSHYQQLIFLYTGKNIYTGRENIWEVLLNAISQNPLFGYGSGMLPSYFLNRDISAHNLYLEIALQVGVIGLLFFVLFLYAIWNTFWINRYNKTVILSACFLIGIIIHQLNEVLFIKGEMAMNSLIWLAIGLGLSRCLNSDIKEEHQDTV